MTHLEKAPGNLGRRRTGQTSRSALPASPRALPFLVKWRPMASDPDDAQGDGHPGQDLVVVVGGGIRGLADDQRGSSGLNEEQRRP
jgi:hypothetical protein